MAESIHEKAAKITNLIRNSRDKPEIRKEAYRLIAAVPERDYAGEMAAIFVGIRDGRRYARDPALMDIFEDPLWTAGVGAGDCDAHTIEIATLMESIGFQTAMAMDSYDGVYYSHVYPLSAPRPGIAITPENAVAMDATLPGARLGYVQPFVKSMVFPVH